MSSHRVERYKSRRLETTTTSLELPKKLKPTQHRIVLKNGVELQYHTPGLGRTFEPLSLDSFLPEHLLEKYKQKLEVEIGPGKGEFLAARAALKQDTCFVGIDRRLDRIRLTEKKLKRIETQDARSNWIVLHEDARSFLSGALPAIDVFHVYQPDPWPKARHHKHRFFRSPDAKAWALAIRQGGELRFSTDHRDYFEEILDIVLSWDLFDLGFVLCKTALVGKAVTHFENIFLRKGQPVYKAVFIRR